MKKSSVVFLQTVVVLIGMGVFVFMLWEPHLEGRNVGATFFQIYFNDPFLAYMYVASIAFFTAVYKAFRLLWYASRNKAVSPDSVRALRAIKYSALSLAGFMVPPEAYLMIVRPGDDIAGGVFMGCMVIFISLVVAAGADVLEGVLRSGVDVKS